MKIIYLLFTLVCAVLCSPVLHSQVISTVAGGGSSLLDGVPATSGNIGYIQSIAIDSKGNLYLADGSHNKIRRIDTSGMIYTVAGTGLAGFSGDTGPAILAQLNVPNYIAVDSRDNLYITDLNNNRIRKVDAVTGVIATIVGNGSASFSGDGISAISASISSPQGITVDIFGNLFIADAGNQRIRKVDTFGVITTYAGNGVGGFSGDGGLADTAKLRGPIYVATDTLGNLYIADENNGRVRMVDAITHIITTIAGNGITAYAGDAVPATTTPMDPWAIILNISGDLVISDHTNNRIRMVDDTGYIHTIAGNGINGFSGDGGLAVSAKIYYPQGLASDRCGNLYIADNQNRRVRKITYPPTPITLTNSISTLVPTACTGTPATFTAAAAASAGTIAYQWYVNGSPVPGATAGSYTYTPADADSIRCLATATSPCTSALTSSNTIIMSVIPVTTPTITIAAPATAPVGSVVTVSATVSGAGTGYGLHWYNNAVLFSTTSVPATTYTKPPGTDHITATVVPGEGCYDSTTAAEWLVSASTMGVGAAISLSSAERRRAAIYPNPVRDILHIDAGNGEAYSIQSMVGQALRQGILQQGENLLPVIELPAGVHILEIVDATGIRSINKIIKQ